MEPTARGRIQIPETSRNPTMTSGIPTMKDWAQNLRSLYRSNPYCSFSELIILFVLSSMYRPSPPPAPRCKSRFVAIFTSVFKASKKHGIPHYKQDTLTCKSAQNAHQCINTATKRKASIGHFMDKNHLNLRCLPGSRSPQT